MVQKQSAKCTNRERFSMTMDIRITCRVRRATLHFIFAMVLFNLRVYCSAPNFSKIAFPLRDVTARCFQAISNDFYHFARCAAIKTYIPFTYLLTNSRARICSMRLKFV